MRRALVVASLALTGCGRLAFDPEGGGDDTHDGAVGSGSDSSAPCVPNGHDEDNDGISDNCDLCPHILGGPTDRDEDGDGVGDACDPNPTTPGDTIELFDPMTSIDPGWTRLSGQGETQEADDILVDSSQFAWVMTRPVVGNGHGTLTLGVDVLGGSTAQRQFLVGEGQFNARRIVYSGPTAMGTGAITFGLSARRDTMYTTIDFADVGGTIATGSSTVSITYGATVSSALSLNGEDHTLDGAQPGDITRDDVGYEAIGTTLRVRYFLYISSP